MGSCDLCMSSCPEASNRNLVQLCLSLIAVYSSLCPPSVMWNIHEQMKDLKLYWRIFNNIIFPPSSCPWTQWQRIKTRCGILLWLWAHISLWRVQKAGRVSPRLNSGVCDCNYDLTAGALINSDGGKISITAYCIPPSSSVIIKTYRHSKLPPPAWLIYWINWNDTLLNNITE